MSDDPPHIAQSIQATTKCDFESGILLANGQRRLSYLETTTARAGGKGDLEIPAQITLGIPVFVGAEAAEQMTARFRYRITNGRLVLRYKLDRPEDAAAEAFAAIVHAVDEHVGVPIMRGTPADNVRV